MLRATNHAFFDFDGDVGTHGWASQMARFVRSKAFKGRVNLILSVLKLFLHFFFFLQVLLIYIFTRALVCYLEAKNIITPVIESLGVSASSYRTDTYKPLSLLLGLDSALPALPYAVSILTTVPNPPCLPSHTILNPHNQVCWQSWIFCFYFEIASAFSWCAFWNLNLPQPSHCSCPGELPCSVFPFSFLFSVSCLYETLTKRIWMSDIHSFISSHHEIHLSTGTYPFGK